MAATPEIAAFDRGVHSVLQIVLPDKAEAVLRFRPDAELQARIEELAAKSTEGQLTESERAEYEGYVRANKFVAMPSRSSGSVASKKSRLTLLVVVGLLGDFFHKCLGTLSLAIVSLH